MGTAHMGTAHMGTAHMGTAHATTQSTAHARHMAHIAHIAQAAHATHAAHRDRDRDAHSRAALAQTWGTMPKARAAPGASGAKASGGKAHGGPTGPAKHPATKTAARTAVPTAAGAAAAAAVAAAAAAEGSESVGGAECRLMQRTHQVVVGLSWGTLSLALQERWTHIHCDRRLRATWPSQGPRASTVQGGAD